MKRLSCCWLLFGLFWICDMGRAQEELPLLPHEVEEQKLPADRPIEVAFCLDVSGSMLSQQRSAAKWILDRTHNWMAKRPVRAALILYYDDAAFSLYDFENGDGALVKGLNAGLGGIWGVELTGKYAALAANRLSWTPGKGAQNRVEKRIIMVGNEAMIAGGFDYQVVVPRLREQGWRLDAVEGNSRSKWTVWVKPDMNQWKHFALLGGGYYERLQGYNTAPISEGRSAPNLTPLDAQIRDLNSQYNQTLMPYGMQGLQEAHKLQKMEQELDETGALFVWILQKIKQSFPKWEFVDAVDSKTVVLANVPDPLLPQLWRGLKGDDLTKELVKTRELRTKIAALLRTVLLQRQLLLAQAQQSEIDAARQRLRNMMARPRPLQPVEKPNPVAPGQEEAPTNPIDNRPFLAQPFNRMPTNPNARNPVDNVVLQGDEQLEAAQIIEATPQDNSTTSSVHTLSNFNDEFTSASTLTRWKLTPGVAANDLQIDTVHNELILRTGAISKSIDGDFAVTIRARVAIPPSAPAAAADNKTNQAQFQFVLRTIDPVTDETTPQIIGWQVSSDNKWQLFSTLPNSLQEKLLPSPTTDEKSFVLLRLARVGTQIFALSQDAEKLWKIDFQTPMQWPAVVQVMLEAKSEKNTTNSAPLTAHIDWVHFNRIPASVQIAEPGNTATQDELWLPRLGHRLDTQK